MFDKAQKIFTTTLTGGILTIIQDYGVTAVSIKLTVGAGTYQGTKQLGAIPSTANALVVDKAVVVSSEQTKYIDELIIDATDGTIEIIAR